MRPILLITLALLAPLAGELQAQRLVPPFPTTDNAESRNQLARMVPIERANAGLLVTGGLVGGAAGLFGGALVGGKLAENDCEDCGLVGLVYGGIAGASALLPLGVHLTNGRRGNYGTSLIASLVLGAAGLGLASATGEWRIMLAVPVAQIASSIAIERGTRR